MATVVAQPHTVVAQPHTVVAQTHTVMQQPTQVIQQPIQAASSQADPRLRHKKSLFRLGATEIAIGGLCIILTIIPLSITSRELERFWNIRSGSYGYGYGYGYGYRYQINTSFTWAASGIWAGIFNIITGILGLRIRSNPSKCNHIANMIMAIITANVTFSAAVLSGIAAGLSYFSKALIAVQAIITVLNVAAMIINIIHASLCCGGACYNEDTRMTQQVIYVPAQPNMAYPQQQPQYVQGPNGQLMLVANQPMAQSPQQGYTPQPVNTAYPGYYPAQQMAQQGNAWSAPPTSAPQPQQNAWSAPPTSAPPPQQTAPK